MNLIAKYATQSVTLERRKRYEDGEVVGDQHSGASYEDPETIQAVYEPVSGTVRTATGASVQAESRILTEREIKLHDKVEGSVVKRVSPVIYFDGQIIGYEAFL